MRGLLYNKRKNKCSKAAECGLFQKRGGDMLAKKWVRFPLLGGYLALTCCLAVFLYWYDPQKTPFLPCLFHLATGLDCPGCGMTRAFHALLHLHFLQALHFNAFFIVLAPLLAIAWLEGFSFLARARFFRLKVTIPPAAVITFAVLLSLFTVARNLPVPPFCYLKV